MDKKEIQQIIDYSQPYEELYELLNDCMDQDSLEYALTLVFKLLDEYGQAKLREAKHKEG